LQRNALKRQLAGIPVAIHKATRFNKSVEVNQWKEITFIISGGHLGVLLYHAFLCRIQRRSRSSAGNKVTISEAVAKLLRITQASLQQISFQSVLTTLPLTNDSLERTAFPLKTRACEQIRCDHHGQNSPTQSSLLHQRSQRSQQRPGEANLPADLAMSKWSFSSVIFYLPGFTFFSIVLHHDQSGGGLLRFVSGIAATVRLEASLHQSEKAGSAA
jgi:hypothetical protein